MDGEERARAVRVRRARRDGVSPVPVRLDALIGPDHLARRVWAAVAGLDLGAFRAEIGAVAGGPGAPATDPAVLVALWLYATSQGVTAARELDRLCVEHVAYIWLCGGLPMNYHSLGDFRVRHEAALDAVFTQVVGRLDAAGLVDVGAVAQDGVRVRASAGAASFHRRATLEAHRAAAGDGDGDTGAPATARQRAARARAGRERRARLDAALAALPPAPAPPPADSAPPPPPAAPARREPRRSSTDPEARAMKMADGGFRPAYNVEFATTTGQKVVVGVDVTTAGTDTGQAPPMAAQVRARAGRPPGRWLMDGGFADLASIQRLADQRIEVLAPPRPARNPRNADRARPQPTDTPELAAWRARMATPEAQRAYRQRAATAELVHAFARCRHGLTQLGVRGLGKVRCVALWTALTHNLLRGLRALLAPEAPCARQRA